MADRIRIPVPDPFGLLSGLTKNLPIETFDPLSDAKNMLKSGQDAGVVKEDKGKDYIDAQIEKYTYHLQQALKYAPCPGCRKLVISALVGVEIYKAMEKGGLKREDVTQEEIDRIKKEVEEKYAG